MAPSAGISVGWDQLYGRTLQCHFLPFGDEDLISSRSLCLPRCLPWGRGRKEGREGTAMPRGPGGIHGHRSHPWPRIQDAQQWRLRSQPGKVGSGGVRVGGGERRGRLPSEPLHCPHSQSLGFINDRWRPLHKQRCPWHGAAVLPDLEESKLFPLLGRLMHETLHQAGRGSAPSYFL